MNMDEEQFYKQATLPTLVDAEAPAPLPEKIGPYKIEALLSKGGMSLLYLGLDPKTREPRAIKVLSPSFVNHPEMVDHFMWEAKIIELASHPNIVRLYDHGKWEGGLYIAMEFIRGVSLSQFIMQQSFSLKRTLGIVLQIAYALCHLHTHGVIHRDLKPENILISEDGEVKVIDFGISQLHEDQVDKRTKLPGKIIGTPGYMSPEQREDPHNVSFTSDIYALGVITYELIVGKLSYGMIDLSLLPTGLQKIVGKAIAVSLNERYQDIVDFITDITSYASSSEMQRERTMSDQAVETLEVIKLADSALSPSEIPNWNEFDIGLSRLRAANQFGLYTDFFKFANNTYAIIVAQTLSSTPSAPIAMGVLKGMIYALLQPKIQKPTETFSPTAFASALSSLLSEEKLKEQFRIAILKLIPRNDTLTFLSCGFGPLLHLPQGTRSVRVLTSDNPLLGSGPALTFNETSDNWREGDLLVLHSLDAEQLKEGSILDTQLRKATLDNALLSPLRASDAILKSVAAIKEFELQRHPKALLAIQRII